MNALSPELFNKYPPDAITKSLLASREKLLRASREEVIAADRLKCASLAGFIREGWHVIEPGTPYVHGFHIDVMAEHLEALANGKIRRLMITIPPGMAKSTCVSVFFPMWLWGPKGRPSARFVGVSHEQSLGVRDNLKCRRLVQSEWFQERWPMPIAKDQNEKLNFENLSTGFRQVATPSNVTGKRGDFVLCDDLLSVENANSPVEREKVNLWMQEALPTRMNDPERSAIVLIMQRVHEDDAVGMILAKKWGWDHLNLPMRYEVANKSHTSIGWEDPRSKEGELLFPERFPEPVVKELERTLGSFATSSQLQQRPVPREGGLFKRAWFNLVKAAPVNARYVRYWDLAATEEQMSSEAAYTVGLKLGRTTDGRFIVADVARLRAEGQGVRRLIRETAREDGPYVEIGLPQDPGQSGKVQAQDMVLMLAGYIVSATRESGDKLTRAEPVAAQAEAGNIDIVEGEWTEKFLDELTTFPGSKFKDQVDALSGAFNKLIGGTVFGIPEELIAMEPIKIMGMWPQIAAIHISRTTVTTVWAFHNPVTDVAFIHDTLTVPRTDMAVHAHALKLRGRSPNGGPLKSWIPVLFNLTSDERDRDEGKRLAQVLADLDVEIMTVEIDDEVATDVIAQRLSTASLRVFSSQQAWFSSYRRLHRDDKNQIAGDDTGMMRATGLIMNSGLGIAMTENRAQSDAEGYNPAEQDRSTVTGY